MAVQNDPRGAMGIADAPPQTTPDPSGGVPPIGGGTGTVPTGSTKTFGGYVYQWNGNQWFNTGVQDHPQTQDNTPNVGLNPATRKYEYFTIGSGGSPVFGGVQAPPVNMNPGSSTSTNYSFQDPAALEIQRQQLAQQAAQATAALNEQIRQAQVAHADAVAALDYTKSKDAFAQSIDNKRLQNETQQQLFTQQNNVATLQLSIAGMQAQRDQINATITAQNADRALAAQKDNLDYENQRQQTLAGLATDIGTVGQNPIDYGKYASTVLGAGNGVFGHQDNTSSITDRSLAPLQSLLDTRQQVMGAPSNPYQAQQAPLLGALDLSKIAIPGITTQAPAATAGPSGAADLSAWLQAHPSGYAPQQTNAGGAAPNPDTPANPTQQQANKALADADVPYFAGHFDRGGIVPPLSGRIVGERGPELEIDLPGGRRAVLNQKEMKAAGLDLKALKKIPHAADGGIFDLGSVFGGSGDTSGARDFNQQALGIATAGTPWQNGNIPSAVYGSTPGFSNSVNALIASTRQLAGYQPIQDYQQQQQQVTPLGFNQQYGHTAQMVGRSA